MLGELELFGSGEEEEETDDGREGTDDGESEGFADGGSDGASGDGADDVGETDAGATKTNEVLALAAHAGDDVGVDGVYKWEGNGGESRGDEDSKKNGRNVGGDANEHKNEAGAESEFDG